MEMVCYIFDSFMAYELVSGSIEPFTSSAARDGHGHVLEILRTPPAIKDKTSATINSTRLCTSQNPNLMLNHWLDFFKSIVSDI